MFEETSFLQLFKICADKYASTSISKLLIYCFELKNSLMQIY